MKKMIAIATFVVMTASGVFAQYTTWPGNGNGKGQGQGQRQGLGNRQGKKMGPQDGSGPIHTPGTGGGAGSGQRGPRR